MKRDRPNIIYILGDDHRAEYMRCAGHPILETPNLDALAREGVRFDQAFCTSPLCTPSRTGHYLGQWERRHGVNFNSRSALTERAWSRSFPMVLKENGYFLGWVGKNHVPAGRGGYDSGLFESCFDYWYGNHGHSFFYVKEHPRGAIYRNARLDTQVEVFEEGAMNFLDPQPAFLEACPSPLPSRPMDQPFCLCITFNLPHDCGTTDMQLRPTDDPLYVQKYRDRFDDFPLPKTYRSAWEHAEPKLPPDVYNGIQIPYYDYVRMPETMREKIVRTAQTVTGVDRMIGRLRAKLDELGEADNTILVFSTDHGLHFGEFGLGGKSLLYEPDLRIPLIVCDPRLPSSARGRVAHEMVAVPDLAPTVLELAGLPVPDTMQGTSLVPLVRGEPAVPWREELFAEALMDIQNYPRSECVRTRRWKYIRYFRRTEDPAQATRRFKGTLDDYRTGLDATAFGREQPVYEELYDLQDDPHEERNRIHDPALAGEVRHFRSRILALGASLKEDGVPPDTWEYDNRL